MSARVEAAAKTFPGYTEEAQADDLEREINAACRSTVKRILAAADAVMFNDAAIERAAKALNESYTLEWDELPEWAKRDFCNVARTVVAALKEGTE
ncbi:hypothetical protein [Pseudarthrobacter sp. S9]|uniref:hypothetical protein n=1 Tax=Pseudarthrobacter sp. S9 TaxID=3418421 RepID=UPI003CFE0621